MTKKRKGNEEQESISVGEEQEFYESMKELAAMVFLSPVPSVLSLCKTPQSLGHSLTTDGTQIPLTYA